MSRQDKITCLMAVKLAVFFGLVLLMAPWQNALMFIGGSLAIGVAFCAVFYWLPEWKKNRDFRQFARDIEVRRK